MVEWVERSPGLLKVAETDWLDKQVHEARIAVNKAEKELEVARAEWSKRVEEWKESI